MSTPTVNEVQSVAGAEAPAVQQVTLPEATRKRLAGLVEQHRAAVADLTRRYDAELNATLAIALEAMGVAAPWENVNVGTGVVTLK